mmetsp:Transcript_35998/g.90451  ORF Transcript_35998/g.90451 Transcript_35998/m.90451 type:complete len:197 (-) Transcript_35998:132-722(-)
MASASHAGAPYAAFLSLPGVSGGGSDSGRDVKLPANLATGAGLERAEGVAKVAFDLARQVLADHEKWEQDKAKEEVARRERKALLQVPDTSGSASSGRAPEAAARPTQATLWLNFPDGRKTPLNLEVSQSAFDVYAKIFEGLQDKERQFFSTITGPRDGGPRVDKKLDDGSFSMDLKSLGVQAGKQYDVKISQGRG